MIEVQLTNEQKNSYIDRNEGHFFDRKSKQISPASLLKTISAFANADGGEALIGLEDPENGGDWLGFDSPEDANGHIQAIDEIFPLGSGIGITFLSHQSSHGYLLRLDVGKSKEIIKVPKGEVYVRRGPRNHKVTSATDLERLKLNKGITTFEDSLAAVPLSLVSEGAALRDFLDCNAISSSELEWLEKQLLVRDGKVSVAALMLFCDEPQVVLPSASIKVYRYRTIEETGTRDTLVGIPISIEGNAYSQIKNAVSKIREITNGISVIGVAGMERIEFPEVAIHEVVANAVLHRDYSIDDSVHVRIFDNRVEVRSPGVLPGHVTVKNILKSRSIRNNKICRLINKFRNPPNKDVGEGLSSAFQAMRDLKLRSPEIHQDEATVTVLLRHERLGSAEESIINYLSTHEEINNTIARELCAINDANKMKRVLLDMVKGGVVVPIPNRSRRYAGYQKGPNFKKPS